MRLDLKNAITPIWLVAGVAAAEEPVTPPATPVVLELFTSQACSSCVPATKLLSDLSDREGVIVLGWHVDIWNALNTKDGQWVDPYSSADNTARQKKYNENIRRRRTVYTPQMVIAGAAETVGSKIEKIEPALSTALENAQPTAVTPSRRENTVHFDVAANPGGNAYLVSFRKAITTPVRGGENAGVELRDVNVVTKLQKLGAVRRLGASYSVDLPESGYGCALLIQEPGQGPIVDAAYCPES